MNKFKVGQRVIGNKYNYYSVTKEGSVWFVSEVKNEDYIRVFDKEFGRSFLVNSAFFDLFMEEVE